MITGGGSGIGYAIARSVCLTKAAIFVITGRNEKKLLAASKELVALATNDPIKVVAEVCDVREPYSVDALFDMVQTRFGRIDILINNAGISQAPTAIEQTSVEMWREMIDINLNGMFLALARRCRSCRPGARLSTTCRRRRSKSFRSSAPIRHRKPALMDLPCRCAKK